MVTAIKTQKFEYHDECWDAYLMDGESTDITLLVNDEVVTFPNEQQEEVTEEVFLELLNEAIDELWDSCV